MSLYGSPARGITYTLMSLSQTPTLWQSSSLSSPCIRAKCPFTKKLSFQVCKKTSSKNLTFPKTTKNMIFLLNSDDSISVIPFFLFAQVQSQNPIVHNSSLKMLFQVWRKNPIPCHFLIYYSLSSQQFKILFF